MHIKLKKLKIKKQQLKSLPLFYNYILHNELIPNDPYRYTTYSRKFSSILRFHLPEKPISKIIDPS